MKPLVKEIVYDKLVPALKGWPSKCAGGRLGLVTSIDGRQLICLMLDPKGGRSEIWRTPIEEDFYKSLSLSLPAAHWFERSIWDLFGLRPEGHPRLKHLLLHEQYRGDFNPLRSNSLRPVDSTDGRQYKFLEVKGEGVYEIPVGPIHAGIIEPGHFRFSCFGENILNLEMRLGYLHRGVEKRITEVSWTKSRFIAEAASSDTAVANALAHAIAIESLLGVTVPPLAQALRTLALEIERLAMHIVDVGGMGADIGFLGIASSMGRLRGKALLLGQALTGSRFMRGFILPGGVYCYRADLISEFKRQVKELAFDLKPVLELFMENQVAQERMLMVGHISRTLVEDFGIVGVAARASGVQYDTRQHFEQGLYPRYAPPVMVQPNGDILARTLVRIGEIETSLDVISRILEEIPAGPYAVSLPDKLTSNAIGLGIVEAFRGELIHLLFTNDDGKIRRYAIKDPSSNNWTALSIAIRNNLIADFPLCNKSFSLSYSGNDL